MTAQLSDPFLSQRILDLTATPIQRKLRKLAPMPVGVVFLPWPGLTEDVARQHFRTMKELGFTCLKQTMPTKDWPTERTYRVALDEGIIPFWYAEGGWEDITPELLSQLGLDPAMDIDEAMAHPDMVVYQKTIINQQIEDDLAKRQAEQAKKELSLADSDKNKTLAELRARQYVTPGVVGNVKGHELDPSLYPKLIEWLQQRYGTVEQLKEAWNCDGGHVGLMGRQNRAVNWQTWDDVEKGLDTDIATKDYKHYCDYMRFRADTFIDSHIKPMIASSQLVNANVPVRAGGEMGIFLPFASRGTDMEGIARAMAEGGSFYPSIHLTWHFEEAFFEVARGVYMQAAMTADWGKGIWNATWESSGGPSWFSGGKSPFVPWAQDKTPGFTCHAGTQTILMLSWLAAGYRGFGLWSWNARTAGWEAGEFALLDRNNDITPRTIRAGAIGKAAVTYRRELWQADKQPMVGVLQDFDQETMWAAMGITGRDMYKSQPIRARMGASRALMNGNIPWEHVTTRQLADGLGPRYATIYMPAFISLSEELLSMLTDYVQQGGRVVMDMPSGYLDGYGRTLSTAAGSAFEQLFGVVLHEYGYARAINNTWTMGETALQGFTAVMTPTTAQILASYSDQGGAAITENQLGTGTAVVLGAEASLGCHQPGNEDMEQLIRQCCINGSALPYHCDGVLAYRLVAPTAQHFFLINDGPAKDVMLRISGSDETTCIDPISGETVDLTKPITVEREGGRWLRVAPA